MPTRVFYSYAPDALVIDPGTGEASLVPGYSAETGRTRIEATDGDNFAGGDSGNDEIGDDNDQTAIVYDGDGEVLSSGILYVEELRWYEAPDGSGISVNVFEIAGEVVGFVPSAPLEPGVSYTYLGSTEPGQKLPGQPSANARNQYSFYEQNSVACFGPGTMIATQEGDMPVEWLESTDMVLTRDNGFQPILWISRTRLEAGYFRQYPEEAPLCIPAGVLGEGMPVADLFLTGDHRVLIASPLAELLHFSPEVIAPAKAWSDQGLAQPVRPGKSYTLTHILCADHQIILAQGAWVESFFSGPEAMRRLSPEQRAHVRKILGESAEVQRTARPCVTRKEAALLIEDHRRPAANGKPLRRIA